MITAWHEKGVVPGTLLGLWSGFCQPVCLAIGSISPPFTSQYVDGPLLLPPGLVRRCRCMAWLDADPLTPWWTTAPSALLFRFAPMDGWGLLYPPTASHAWGADCPSSIRRASEVRSPAGRSSDWAARTRCIVRGRDDITGSICSITICQKRFVVRNVSIMRCCVNIRSICVAQCHGRGFVETVWTKVRLGNIWDRGLIVLFSSQVRRGSVRERTFYPRFCEHGLVRVHSDGLPHGQLVVVVRVFTVVEQYIAYGFGLPFFGDERPEVYAVG